MGLFRDSNRPAGRLLPLAENSLEDVIDMLDLSLEVKGPGNIVVGEDAADFGVLFDHLAEISVFFPSTHGVALDPTVGLFAENAFRGEFEQHLAGKHEPAAAFEIVSHAIGIDQQLGEEIRRLCQ